METTISRPTAAYDAELRGFLLSVYNKMGLGLLLTAGLAWLAAHEPLSQLLFTGHGKTLSYTILGWIAAFGPILLLGGLGLTGKASTPGGASLAFWGTSTLFGLSLGCIFMRYTGFSIASTFLITATSFGALSLFGYTTKINLNAIGNFLVVALFGLIIASLVGMFMHSTVLELGITLVGILIFAGFIAYDTQKLKEFFEFGADQDTRTTLSYVGALNLYLDFINLFLLILRLTGQLKDED